MTTIPAQDPSQAQPWLQVSGSRHFGEWLAAEQVSLGLTTYQLGKLLLLGRKSPHELAVFERSFERCMGLCATDDAQTWKRSWSNGARWPAVACW